ncbi:MAG: sulfatase-like hydrolase/transferase, partial [Candidatus Krumholzibacteriia bacterium]
MKRWTLRGAGASFLIVGALGLILAVAEELIPSTGYLNRPGLRPGPIDYVYGINLHLLLALGVSLCLRLAAWRVLDRDFPLIALGGFLVVELGVVATYWVGRTDLVPPFFTLAGKIVTAGIAAAGALLGVLVPLLIARRFPRDLFLSRARGTLGTVGVVATVALVLGNAVALWSARPREDAIHLRADADTIEKPDVFVLLVDTLRRDHLSFFGYERPTSPHLDSLFAESWVFTNAYTPSTWTPPSVASLFTGLYPSTHGVTSLLHAIPEEVTTLAEQFRSYGYRTAGFISNPMVTRRKGFAQGFDHFLSPEPPWWCYHRRTAVELIVNRFLWGPGPHWPSSELAR